MKSRWQRFVFQRAGGHCEYCLIHQDHDDLPHHMDHIVARKHGGLTIEANLSLACANCSLGKGPNIAALDHSSQQLTRLFNPRTDAWEEHFRWRGPKLTGRSAIGRATISVLNINQRSRVELRRCLMEIGRFPPPLPLTG